MNATTTTYHVGLAAGAACEMTSAQLREAYAARTITAETLVWRDGLEEWLPLGDLAAELRLPAPPKALRPTPGTLEKPVARRPRPERVEPIRDDAAMPDLWNRPPANFGKPPRSPQSLGAFQAFALFFGIFGAHNFYIGRTAPAVWQLGLTLTLVGAPISFLWALIDMCIVDRDGRGRRLA